MDVEWIDRGQVDKYVYIYIHIYIYIIEEWMVGWIDVGWRVDG